MTVLREIFNDPVNFFKKKRDLSTGLLYMAISLFVFVLLNQAMIYFSIVSFNPVVDPITAMLLNYFTLLGGYFILASISVLPFKMIGGKKTKDMFVIVAYSLIPVMFFWIPHIIAQAIILFLSMVLFTRGVAICSNSSNRKALIVTVFFLILVILASISVRNFILLFGNFNIFV